MRLHDIAFFIAFFFIVGIAAASVGLNVWLSILGAALIGLLLVSPRRYIAVFVLAAFVGFFYFNFSEAVRREYIPFGDSATFEGVVFREPRHGFSGQQLDVKLVGEYKGEVRIYTTVLPRYEFGDKIRFVGVVEKSPSGRLNTLSFPDISVIGKDNEGVLRPLLFGVKDSLVSNLERVLAPEQAALASGLLFGERAQFSNEFEEAMRKSGTTHIVALSGYNVAIIVLLLSSTLSYIVSRRHAFWISIGGIIAFVAMTGAEASVVRAGIMGIIAMLAERESRLYSFRNAITLTAFVMLLFNPRLLVFDLGFQLSFAALLGIVYLYPLFKRWLGGFLERGAGVFNWKHNLFQTLSAQLAVLPIVIASFGYFSPMALVANVLILEFIPLTMALAFSTAIAGYLSFVLSLVIGWAAGFFLWYEAFIIRLFGASWF